MHTKLSNQRETIKSVLTELSAMHHWTLATIQLSDCGENYTSISWKRSANLSKITQACHKKTSYTERFSQNLVWCWPFSFYFKYRIQNIFRSWQRLCKVCQHFQHYQIRTTTIVVMQWQLHNNSESATRIIYCAYIYTANVNYLLKIHLVHRYYTHPTLCPLCAFQWEVRKSNNIIGTIWWGAMVYWPQVV